MPSSTLRIYGQWGGLMLIAVAAALLFVPLIGRVVEQPPIRWTNQPFPTNDPIPVGGALSTYVERCNSTGRTLMTTVARRLVEDATGHITILLPTAGIVEPGCTSQTGGGDLPRNVAPGVYHVEYLIQVDGTFKTFYISARSQSFTVVEPL